MRGGINDKQQLGHIIEGSKRIKGTAWVKSKTREEGKKQALLNGISSSKNQYHKITAQSEQSLIKSRSFRYVWFAVFVHGPSHMCPLKKRLTDVLTV